VVHNAALIPFIEVISEVRNPGASGPEVRGVYRVQCHVRA
jgi:hypothetical protein